MFAVRMFTFHDANQTETHILSTTAVEESRIRSLRQLIHDLKRADEEADEEEVRWPLNNEDNKTDPNLCMLLLLF